MADPTALYSYKGNEPSILPNEISWVEEWGQITYRTDVNSFTDEELKKAGYVGPYTVPSINIEYQTRRWDGESLTYVVEDISDEELWFNIRKKRNQLLKDSDWTALVDSPDILNYNEWFMYRQRLRDLTAMFENPKEVIWPESPEGKSDSDFDQERIYDEKWSVRMRDLESHFNTLNSKIVELRASIIDLQSNIEV
jgi:hypothetical protein